MFLDGERKLERPEGTHTYTGRTWKVHTERPRQDLNQEPSCCEVTVQHHNAAQQEIKRDQNVFTNQDETNERKHGSI